MEDELERLRREATEAMVKYVKLNEAYNARLPKADMTAPSWVLDPKELEELERMGKEVNQANEEWNRKLKEYLEKKAKNK